VNIKITAAIVLAVLAFVLVLIGGFFTGINFWLLIFRGMMGAGAFALLGVGIGFLIESQLPEIATVFNTSSSSHAYETTDEASIESAESVDGAEGDLSNGEGIESAESVSVDASDIGAGSIDSNFQKTAGAKSNKVEKVGNNLVIGDKQFPNNPAQLASAIQTKMASDDE